MSTYSDISSLANAIQEQALLTAREQAVMAGLVTIFSGAQEGEARKLYTYNSAGTLTQLPETTDLTASTFTPSLAQTLTPYIYGAQYTATDVLMTSDWNDTAAKMGQDAGQRLVVDQDTKLVSLFSTFTGGTVGSAGGTLTWSDVFRARAYLKRALAPYPYSCVLAPEQSWELFRASSGVPTLMQSQKYMDDLAGNFYLGSYGGINFYEDGNITAGTAAAAGMFSRQAIALDIRRAPRIEYQRNASLGGGVWEINFTSVFAYGLYRPTFGVYMIGTTSGS